MTASDSTAIESRRPRALDKLTLCMLLGGLIGFFLLWTVNWNRDLRPVYLPIPDTAGETTSATFTPTHSDVYEVEVELREPAEKEVFDSHIRTTELGGFEAVWIAEVKESQIASGKLSSYLYLSMTGPSRRRARQLLGLESYRNISTARMSRGIGRFKAKVGETIRIIVESGVDVPEAVSKGEPHLVVRLNRKSTETYLSQSLLVACLLALGVAGGIGKLLLRCFSH